MPPLIDVCIMVWFKIEGEDRFSTFEKKIFSSDADWIARQYAEVNGGHCKIFQGETKIADHKVVHKQ
ncbi:mRNA endoribonuclease [Erwinia phage Cronus]|uniref:mRNA endoribonuclease n=1 Tax=Erwinia phage Cronus TaxID=2163633 RepID=A0A2S1GM23_9CAUD|nr:mRNA endoribonuclease [Erwinia phage Cronus]AWD90436.1 mRNA endoribonuclease [Erwinia phage Cronus]